MYLCISTKSYKDETFNQGAKIRNFFVFERKKKPKRNRRGDRGKQINRLQGDKKEFREEGIQLQPGTGMGGFEKREASPEPQDERRSAPPNRETNAGGGLVAGADRGLVQGQGIQNGVEVKHLRIHPSGQGMRRGPVHALQVQAEASETCGWEIHADKEQGRHRGASGGSRRVRFGDWEMDLVVDLVVGACGKGAMVTLVERSTSYSLIRNLPQGKNADGVAKAVIDMLLPFKRFGG
ncbi:MAG: hypothetical protein MJZ86_10915, partial [Bacteroidales bacterium]|nr:hypothetical protein [Bacteroidales bacterium]